MNSNSPSMKSPHFYPKIWMTCGVIILIASAILWIWLQLVGRVTKERSFNDTDTAVSQTIEADQFPSDLGSLTDIVPVLDLTKVAVGGVADSAHGPQFQAATFIAQHEDEWTLQVMNVPQESVITDYLSKRTDRDRFQYFHYNAGQKDESYILTFGDFTTVETAIGAMQTMDFALPANVKAFPERFSSYKPYVNDTDNTGDLSLGAPRQVKLRPVASPPPTDAIEDKLDELSAQSATGADGQAVQTSQSGALPAAGASSKSLPAAVDGFSGQPDAPPDSAPDTSNSKASPSGAATPATGSVQDPFN